MKVLRFLLAIGLVATFGAGTAHAQPQSLDHLKCYKIKDPANFSATVTLEALQTQFGLEDCELKGKAQFFCVPVDKTVTAYKDKTKPPLSGMSLVSQKLDEDRICYKLKCPKVDDSGHPGQRPVRHPHCRQVCAGHAVYAGAQGDHRPARDCCGTAHRCATASARGPEPHLPSEWPPPASCSCQPPPHDLCPDTAPSCNGDCPVIAGSHRRSAGPRPTARGVAVDNPPTPCSAYGSAVQRRLPNRDGLSVTTTGKCDCFDRTRARALPPASAAAPARSRARFAKPTRRYWLQVWVPGSVIRRRVRR